MKTIFITGANEGIGYHMVHQFLEDGRNVAVFDINIDGLGALQENYPRQLLALEGDVGNQASLCEAVVHVLQHFGTLDYAIHNACFCPFGAFEDLTNEEYQKTFKVNYDGALHLCRAVLPTMKQKGAGKVFFTSSAVGVTGFPGISAYASSKGALETLAKCLDLEYQDMGVRFQILHPPLTKTKSAEPLPIPQQMKLEPELVGRGLAKRIASRQFVICHNRTLQLQLRMMYLFPRAMGKLLTKGAKKWMEKNI